MRGVLHKMEQPASLSWGVVLTRSPKFQLCSLQETCMMKMAFLRDPDFPSAGSPGREFVAVRPRETRYTSE
jgi:hypothetical protein